MHLNRLKEKFEIEKDVEKEIFFLFDHVNKIARIEKEIIRYKNPKFFKKYLIAYDEGYTDYVERKNDCE